jgi:hypothetical protein
MKNRLFDRLPMLEVLDDDSLQQRRGDLGIPGSFRVHYNDRPVAADAEAGGLTALYAARAEEEILSLQKPGEQPIELAAPAIRRAEVAGAHEHVTSVRLHLRLLVAIHSAKIHLLTSPSTCTAVNSN